MLRLMVKIGDRVKISDDIWVSVEKIERGQVGLGFIAPRSVPILREALVDRGDRDRAAGDGAGTGGREP